MNIIKTTILVFISIGCMQKSIVTADEISRKLLKKQRDQFNDTLFNALESGIDLTTIKEQDFTLVLKNSELLSHYLVNYWNPDFGTCLICAALETSNEVRNIEFLLKSGADKIVNKPNYKGYTPLHYAAGLGKCEMIQILLRYGADPTIKDYRNEIPLQVAARVQQYKAVQVLVEELI